MPWLNAINAVINTVSASRLGRYFNTSTTLDRFATTVFNFAARRCASHAGDSSTFRNSSSNDSDGTAPITNSTRHAVNIPVPCRVGNSRYTSAASILPTTYPSCNNPEKNPRPSAGKLSSASAAPTPHSPPIATPNSARIARNQPNVGANADAITNTE